MKLKISSPAKKQLSKIPKTETKKISRKIDNLLKNPQSGKKLQGPLKNYYSLRAWPYRIVYQTDHSKGQIIIVSIRHRQSAYH